MIKVLEQELSEGQYIALLGYATRNEKEYSKMSNEFKIGLIMGIKARVD